MRNIELWFLTLLILLSGSAPGRAQTVTTSTNLNPTSFLAVILTNAFDLTQSFSGVAEINFSDEQPLNASATVRAQAGSVRIDVTPASLETGVLPPALAKLVAAERRRQGLSRYFVLLRNGDPLRYTVYPDRRAYHTNEFQSLLPSVDWTNRVTLTQVQGGRETVEGHPCHKVEWRMTDGSGSQSVLMIWKAGDLHDFPVKIQMDREMTVTFRQLTFVRLDPALFEIPPGYRCLDSIQAIAAEALGKSPNAVKADTKADVAARVMKWHQELADQGDAYGEYRMGLRYRDGDGVPQDLKKARDLFQKSAAQGHADAVAALAKLPRLPDAKRSSPSSAGMNDSDLAIQSAEFGMGGETADVTARLVELLHTQPEGFTVNAQNLGADPLPGKKKRLTIHYDYQGVACVLTIQAGKRMDAQSLVKNALK
jgi:hypothetical protein